MQTTFGQDATGTLRLDDLLDFTGVDPALGKTTILT